MTAADTTTYWLTLAAAGAGTFLIRYSFIGILGRTGVPEWAMRLLRYVPPAALAALVVPAVIHRGENPGLHLGNHRLLAACLALAIAAKTKNIPITIAVGMAALWLLQWFGF